MRLIQLALLAALLASGSVSAQPGSNDGATPSGPTAAQQAPGSDGPDDKPAPESGDDAPQPSSPDVFRPSEEISEDLSVPFPTDI